MRDERQSQKRSRQDVKSLAAFFVAELCAPFYPVKKVSASCDGKKLAVEKLSPVDGNPSISVDD